MYTTKPNTYILVLLFTTFIPFFFRNSSFIITSKMELGFISKTIINILGVILVIILMVRRINSWVYEYKLGEKRHNLPPGDLGLPYIGNMWSFLRAFKSTNPDSFINTFITRSFSFFFSSLRLCPGAKMEI